MGEGDAHLSMGEEAHHLVDKMMEGCDNNKSGNVAVVDPSEVQGVVVTNANPTTSMLEAETGENQLKKKEKREKLLNIKYLLLLLAVYLAFILLGGMIFHFLESSHSLQYKKEAIEKMDAFLANKTCVTKEEVLDLMKDVLMDENPQVRFAIERFLSSESRWNFADAMLFSTTIVTTIGYGNITPSTSAGRSVAVFYALLGIPLFVIASGQLGLRLNSLNERIAEKIKRRSWPPKYKDVVLFLVASTMGFVFFMLGAAGIFCAAEGWTYAESLYFAFISLTTIGFGDFYPSFRPINDTSEADHQLYIIFVTIWILLGLVWMASIMSTLSNFAVKFFKRWRHGQSKDQMNTEQAAIQVNEDVASEEDEE